jgi:hypothetical protein
MVVFAVVVICWLLLTVPVSVFLGACISRGLAPVAEPTPQVHARPRALEAQSA